MCSGMGSGKPDWQLKTLALSLPKCMTLCRLPNVSVLSLLIRKKTNNNSTCLLELGGLTEIMFKQV